MFICQETFESGQEEVAEFPFGGIERVEIILLNHPIDKGLGQVLRGVRRMALAAGEAIKRSPVGSAEFFQGGAGRVGISVGGGEHNTPMSRIELCIGARWR